MNFVFWQSYLMCHQAAYIRALADRPDCQVKWVVEQPLPTHYRTRGYPIPALGKVEVVIAPDQRRVHELLADDPQLTTHVFMGLRRSRLSGRAFHASKAYPVKRLLLTENRFERNWRLPLRWGLYLYQALISRRYLDRVLCMGYGGVWGGRSWLRLCGYPDRMISPFAYTSEEGIDEATGGDATPASAFAHGSKPGDIVFVGQLVRRKGLDLLLRALADPHAFPGYRLTVVGSGPEETSLKRLADELALGRQVSFVGNLDHAAVGTLIATHQMLVLPSRFDGWGAVVNEALLAGTPVVCSDRAGASDLVLGSGFGKTFRSGDVSDLKRSIRGCLAISASPTHHAAWWEFRDCMRGPSVAQYLLDLMSSVEHNAPMPVAPWLAASEGASSGRKRPVDTSETAQECASL